MNDEDSRQKALYHYNTLVDDGMLQGMERTIEMLRDSGFEITDEIKEKIRQGIVNTFDNDTDNKDE